MHPQPGGLAHHPLDIHPAQTPIPGINFQSPGDVKSPLFLHFPNPPGARLHPSRPTFRPKVTKLCRLHRVSARLITS